jgi:hypothetical protein
MKSTNFGKLIGAGVLALGLAVMPATLPAGATTSDNPTVDTTPFQESSDDFNNLGWLGLIGLLGLANLFRKPRTVQRYNDPSSTRS